jgi:hypothetical protein
MPGTPTILGTAGALPRKLGIKYRGHPSPNILPNQPRTGVLGSYIECLFRAFDAIITSWWCYCNERRIVFNIIWVKYSGEIAQFRPLTPLRGDEIWRLNLSAKYTKLIMEHNTYIFSIQPILVMFQWSFKPSPFRACPACKSGRVGGQPKTACGILVPVGHNFKKDNFLR